MNRGCVTYFKEGIKGAVNALKKDKKNYFKYYMFLIASALGSLFLITIPIFLLANIRMARYAKENEDIEVHKSFTGAENPKRWLLVLLTNLLVGLILAGGSLAIALPFATGIPFIMSLVRVHAIIPTVLMALLYTVLYALLLVFSILTTLKYVPVNYIIDKNSSLSVSEVLQVSHDSMGKDGKITYFGLEIFYSILIGIVTFFLMIPILLIVIFNENTAVFIVGSLFLGGILLIILLLLPIFVLGNQISIISLFDDVIEMNTAEESSSTPNVTQVTESSNPEPERELSTEELLNSIFEE